MQFSDENLFQINHIYSIANFYVNEENAMYPNRAGSTLQIILKESSTEIQELDEQLDFPPMVFKFISLSEVQITEKNETIGK